MSDKLVEIEIPEYVKAELDRVKNVLKLETYDEVIGELIINYRKHH